MFKLNVYNDFDTFLSSAKKEITEAIDKRPTKKSKELKVLDIKTGQNLCKFDEVPSPQAGCNESPILSVRL